MTYVPQHPMFHVAVHDLPGLMAAIDQTALGRLLAAALLAETGFGHVAAGDLRDCGGAYLPGNEDSVRVC